MDANKKKYKAKVMMTLIEITKIMIMMILIMIKNGVNREIFHRQIIIRVALHKEYFDIHCFQSSWRKQKLMTFFSVGKAVQTILHKICGRNFDGVLQFISIAEVEVTWTYLI